MNSFFSTIKARKYGLALGVSLLIIASVVLVGVSKMYGQTEVPSPTTPLISETKKTKGVADIVPTIIFENIPDESFVPFSSGKEIRVNLVTMKLSRYEDGILLDTMTLTRKGLIGSYWETPGGSYSVSEKLEDYYSEKVGAYLPYSLQLFGNYVIHGEPHDKNGRSYSTNFTNGSMRLSNENAKTLFLWADVDTPVSIFSDSALKPAVASTKSVYVTEDGTTRPNVSAESYIVGDVDTGEIIISKNDTAVFPIASVSKLMTTLVSLDTMNQFDFATVSKEAVSTLGTSGLRPGEKIELSNLIYPLLLSSSNDAAEVIAEHLGRDTFIKNMNDKARALGMLDTKFEDPSGLSPQNVSTVSDLFKLAEYIQREESFIYDITKHSSYSAQGHTWSTVSGFLQKIPGYVGSKSGLTEEAKQTTISLFSLPLSEGKNRNIAIILLRSDDKKSDILKILSYLQSKVVFGREGIFSIANDKESAHEATLSFVGDIMLDRGVKYSVRKNFSGNYSHLFDNTEFLRDSDLFFANLEGPVSDTGKDLHNLYSFRMEPQVLSVLKAAGVDIVSFANNHVGDWGRTAFDDTRKRLTNTGIAYTGAGDTKALAEEPTIMEVAGTKIGFLGFTDVGPNSLAAGETNSGILLASDPDLPNIIKNAAGKVDILVTSFHWGDEYKEHNTRQSALAHTAIDNGAKLVIGHHPHVIQATETYKGGIIAYSLGNFIFDQAFSEKTMEGMALQVTFDTEKKSIKRYDKYLVELNPYFQPESITPFK